MQVIEKVKVVPEGYNGAGMDGYGRRDVNGKANAGLTLGISKTVRNISVKNTICKKPTKFVINSKIN